jgi:putative phage-type endonuclease
MIYEEKESYAASRASGIGGTDAAAILGLSPYRKPIDIYAGKVDPKSMPELDKECLFWGSALEPIVRQRYAVRFGVADLAAPGRLAEFFPQTRPWNDATLVIGKEAWMIGAPDGWIPSVKSGLEVKCASRKSDDWGAEGSDEIPAHYYVQAAWYLMVCEAEGWNFATLFSGSRLEQFRIVRDPVFEKHIVEAARAFWFEFVLKRVEPPVDQTESYGRYLARKFSLSTGMVISNPSPEIIEAAEALKSAEAAISEAEDAKQLAKNRLAAMIGEAQAAITPIGKIAWVRPEAKAATNWSEVGKAVGPLHPEVVEQFTQTKEITPYIRAWFKK